MTTISKNELIRRAAQRSGNTQDSARDVIEAALAIVGETVAQGGKVQLQNFGTFSAQEREERIMRSPHNGEDILVAATRLPKFKALKGLKDLVAGRTPIKTGQDA
ncbi:HU family DNA-binding protein [Streptomyces sp. NPDC051907]|uniref:HU family DNA-binding protein n=1 Tax=Streptomyces sp. NPDC051907 TaxID=3155284 RepID=UPI00341CFBF3